jgi:hypothetical protein
MITEADLRYHLLRAAQERRCATQAANLESRMVHLELAESHSRRAEIARSRLRTLGIPFYAEPTGSLSDGLDTTARSPV